MAKVERLVFGFEEHLFAPGSFQLSKEGQRKLKYFVEILKKHSSGLEVIVVGHTDSVPYRKRKGVIESNYDLSVLRASKTLGHLVKLGLDQEQLSAKGKAYFSINARTISLELVRK